MVDMVAQVVEEEREQAAAEGRLAPWLARLAGLRSCREMLRAIPGPGQSLRLLVSAEGPRPALVALLHAEAPCPLLLVTPGPEVARRLYEALRLYSPHPQAVLFYPAGDTRPYERMSPDPALVAQRLTALERLRQWRGQETPPLIVAEARAILQPTLSPVEWEQASQQVRRGGRLPLETTTRQWIEWGYRPARLVTAVGEIARRGGIVDIYPPTSPLPLRIELVGDEVESIRQFDPAGQRSLRQVASFLVLPPQEVPWWQRGQVVAYLRRAADAGLRPEVADELARDRSYLEQGIHFEGINLYAPLFQEERAGLPDHLPEEALVVLEEPEQVRAALQDLHEQAEGVRFDLVQAGELPADFPLPYPSPEEITARLSHHPRVEISAALPAEEETRPLALPFAPLRLYGGRLKEVLAEVAERRQAGESVILVSHQAARLEHLLRERGLTPQAGRLEVIAGRLPVGGWACPEAHLALLSDREILGWAPPRRRALVRRPRQERAREDLLQQLRVGDYVVHEDHGFAVYEGLVHLALADGVEREYLYLRYAGSDRLYVPVDRVDRVRRYIGAGEAPPALHHLGTADWERTKARVRKAVTDMARELLELYAAREVAQGFAFSPDQPWQAELEAAFPYIETEDQLRAVAQVKTDMEKPRPMDRLVCGDVGYGKTEVALRAAFKAVLDGKQVAVLVPTTVLAQQHFRTFQERLEPFPVNVEMLSRFRRPGEQKQIVERLAQGEVDIVIGTHRLLSRDVSFKDLGLVIVDEEQRFGVRHKEHLKKLRREVDVLTLTATPIPRTLHMGLTGLRDMSVIETPPEERVPLRTYVVPRDDRVIRGAILRELERGGQVYFVHNRVRSIYRVARRLADLVPEARLAIAHGQMPERDLERVMVEFVEGRYDVLVCTTIIESGLDIPNVNTILIDDAVMLGLAQLYQLRGRVGRGALRAYAYLLYRPGLRMGDAAQRRLQAILEATDLGAGLQIAIRDLEIRGAGNLLGAEQSGHIAAVGFDLYSRLLRQAVEELRQEGRLAAPVPAGQEEGLSEPAPVILDLPLPAYLPATYVDDPEVRLQVYRRLAEVRNAHQVREMARELRDRFGEPPPEARMLLDLLRLKVLALRAGACEVRAHDGEIHIRFPEGSRPQVPLKDLPLWLRRRLRVQANLVRLERQGLGERWPEVLRQVLVALPRGEEVPG